MQPPEKLAGALFQAAVTELPLHAGSRIHSSRPADAVTLSAVQGGAVVHTIRSGQDCDAAMAFYRDRQQGPAQQASLNATRYYKESRYQSGQFWVSRGAAIASTSPSQEPQYDAASPLPLHERYDAESPLPSYVRLSDAVQIVEVTVLSENLIRPAPALSHPQLEQPIAYLGGIAVAPLAADLAHGLAMERLLAQWAQQMPLQTAWRIFRWMYAYGILEAQQQNPQARQIVRLPSKC